jgi:hypothetical protein
MLVPCSFASLQNDWIPKKDVSGRSFACPNVLAETSDGDIIQKMPGNMQKFLSIAVAAY